MMLQRIRVRFQKRGDLRLISHLDLMRTFERALRRANLPLRMSEGFNPHPRISFPAALGVGIEGLDEVMEFDLCEWTILSEVEDRLRAQLPQGLDVLRMELGAPRDTAQARAVEYRVTPDTSLLSDARWSDDALGTLMALTDIPVQRTRKGKTKCVDLRPLIEDIRREGAAIHMRFKAGQDGSVHPEEILSLLGFEMSAARGNFDIVRTQVILKD